jgi:hypothetical protein
MTKVASLSLMADKLKNDVVAALKKEFKVKGALNEAQLSVAETLTKQIMVNEEYDKWGQANIKDYIANPRPVNKAVAAIIDDIAVRYEVTEYDAIILSKSSI